jgi:hypothetical protein
VTRSVTAQRAEIEHPAGEVPVRSRVLPMGIPARARSPLEIIRYAAANHLCVDLAYDHAVRRIEAYSLRETAEGHYVLHAVRSDTGQHRSYARRQLLLPVVLPQARMLPAKRTRRSMRCAG